MGIMPFRIHANLCRTSRNSMIFIEYKRLRYIFSLNIVFIFNLTYVTCGVISVRCFCYSSSHYPTGIFAILVDIIFPNEDFQKFFKILALNILGICPGCRYGSINVTFLFCCINVFLYS